MDIEVKNLPPKAYLGISGNCRTFSLGCFFKKNLTILGKNIPNEQVTEVFARYHNVDWKGCQQKGFTAFVRMMFMKWNLEACFGVKNKINLNIKGVEYKTTPEIKTFKAIHMGCYWQVAEAYNRILDYASKNNLKLADESFEFYLNDPQVTKAEDLKTLVVVPIK